MRKGELRCTCCGRAVTLPLHINPLREWTREDGKTIYAVHPLYGALHVHYETDLSSTVERLREIASGERRLPESVAETTLDFDRQQRANGCPDENVAELVAVLERSGR